MSEVLFSVVVACYRQESFVKQSVESVLSQGHPSKEVIVVDDASPDGTAEVLRTFGNSIQLDVLPANGGVGHARNHGASLATGKYLVFLDGDDVLMPWALDVYGRLVTEHSPKILFGQCVRFSGTVPVVRASDRPHEVKFVEYDYFLAKDRQLVYNSSTLVVEREAFLSAGGWSEDIFYQDIQDLLNKLCNVGKTIIMLSPDTVWYRMHQTNAVRKILPFLKGIDILVAKSKAGLYPGGKDHGLERAAWFGGLSYYWAIEGMRTGLYAEGLKLFVTKWWMILLAIVRRLGAMITGRKPVEELALDRS